VIVEMIHDAGGKIYACKGTVDMFHLEATDFCPRVDRILTVGEFYACYAARRLFSPEGERPPPRVRRRDRSMHFFQLYVVLRRAIRTAAAGCES
jgi:hypothetical protein